MKTLNILAIRIDGETQARESINQEAVSEYADSIRSGVEFPPLVVFFDGAEYWLADGFHRWHAHRAAGRASAQVDIRSGTRRDAVLFSLGANAAHGLRRTNADKRKAVSTLLKDEEWARWSDREIARVCGVGAPFVGDIRRAICNPITDAPAIRTVERAGKTYEQDTSKIGKRQEKVEKFERKEPSGNDDALAEARDAILQLAEENERLSDRLAVESMDASDDEKASAAEIIEELRERVRQLEIEVDSLKASRDTYMRESAERLRQIGYWKKQAEKVAP